VSFNWLVTLYQMWFMVQPDALQLRERGL